MRVWIGAIHHDNGTNIYAGHTEGDLYAQLYEYVCEWWDELREKDDSLPEVPPKDYEEAFGWYFDSDMNDEYCDVEETEVKGYFEV